MGHEHMQDLLSDYHDEVLTGAQKAEVTDHLVACQTCRDDLALMREAESVLRRTLVHPTAAETARLVDALRDELMPAPELVWLDRGLTSPQWAVPAFAVVVAGLLVLSRPQQVSYEPAEALLISQDGGFAYNILTSGPETLLALESR